MEEELSPLEDALRSLGADPHFHTFLDELRAMRNEIQLRAEQDEALCNHIMLASLTSYAKCLGEVVELGTSMVPADE